MTDISFSWMMNSDPVYISRTEATVLHDIGFTACRLDDSATISHPEEGIWNFWKCLVPNIKVLLDAGIKPNVGTMWCPAHMAEGKTTYYPYTAGSTVWEVDENGVAIPGRPQKFAAHRPWVVDPPHMSGWFDYGRKLASDRRRIEDKMLYEYINTHAWGNELGGDFYNPLVHTEGRWNEAYARMWYEGAYPFFKGILSVNPKARFTLPDADGEDALRRGIEFSRRDEQINAATLAYSYHPYAWRDFPEDSYERIAAFRAIIKQYGDPSKEEWMSEIGDSGTGRIVEWTEKVLFGLGTPPANINFADRRQFVECINPNDSPDEQFYQPTHTGIVLQDLLRKRRRPSGK